MAIMGASGCGKSVTLRCIAGLLKPDEGQIIINGNTVFDSNKGINLQPQKRKTGFLFQDFALFPNMTVKQNILTVMQKDKKFNINSILERFHLIGLENHYPSQLSGGQKQRCAIARIVVCEPDIIMLDEPFSALDSYLRWKLERELVSLIKEFGKTVIFVSHNRDEVYRLCDKVVVIENGKSERISTKKMLYEHPVSYTDALLTGCKNIFSVHNVDGRAIVPDLGIDLGKQGVALFSGIKYVGIRAKKIVPAFLVHTEEVIFATYSIESVTESVFSMILMVRFENGRELVRWEIGKDIYKELAYHSPVLAVLKEDILLLQ